MIWCQTLRLRQLLWSKAIVQPNGFLSPLVLERLFDLGLSCSRLSCTSPAPLLHLSWPLLHLSWPLLHLSCTSPAPLLTCCTSLPCPSAAPLLHVSLLHLSWNFPAPLQHLSCTPPDPCCTSLPCTSPAEVRRLSERHFKPFQNQCEAMQSFYMFFI